MGATYVKSAALCEDSSSSQRPHQPCRRPGRGGIHLILLTMNQNVRDIFTFLKYLMKRAAANMKPNVTREAATNGKITFFSKQDFGSWFDN